jgi:ferredoxin
VEHAHDKHDEGHAAHGGGPSLNRRQMLWASASHLTIGGVLGSILSAASGCRAPQFHRDDPEGAPPTAYVIDPAICTHNFDCARVCPCDAIGFTGHAEPGEGPECRTCWIDINKCCGCGRCYRVCPDNAIVPCYGPDKIPARELGRAPTPKPS